MRKPSFAVVDPPARVIESPYFNTREAMAYLRLNDTGALYDLMKEQGLPYLRCGGRYRFDRRELDAWLRGTTALELRRASEVMVRLRTIWRWRCAASARAPGDRAGSALGGVCALRVGLAGDCARDATRSAWPGASTGSAHVFFPGGRRAR